MVRRPSKNRYRLNEAIGYPTRCRIISMDGYRLGGGLIAADPFKAQPHVGKEGMAKKTRRGDVRIDLDDGTVLYGYECWWTPI